MSGAKKITILIVDDHELFRKAFIRILKDKPIYSVIGEASDGHEAVEKALQLKPDIIFMDILMPRLDGRATGEEWQDKELTILTFHSKYKRNKIVERRNNEIS